VNRLECRSVLTQGQHLLQPPCLPQCLMSLHKQITASSRMHASRLQRLSHDVHICARRVKCLGITEDHAHVVPNLQQQQQALHPAGSCPALPRPCPFQIRQFSKFSVMPPCLTHALLRAQADMPGQQVSHDSTSPTIAQAGQMLAGWRRLAAWLHSCGPAWRLLAAAQLHAPCPRRLVKSGPCLSLQWLHRTVPASAPCQRARLSWARLPRASRTAPVAPALSHLAYVAVVGSWPSTPGFKALLDCPQVHWLRHHLGEGVRFRWPGARESNQGAGPPLEGQYRAKTLYGKLPSTHALPGLAHTAPRIGHKHLELPAVPSTALTYAYHHRRIVTGTASTRVGCWRPGLARHPRAELGKKPQSLTSVPPPCKWDRPPGPQAR
jgi:hypothetical protein